MSSVIKKNYLLTTEQDSGGPVVKAGHTSYYHQVELDHELEVYCQFIDKRSGEYRLYNIAMGHITV